MKPDFDQPTYPWQPLPWLGSRILPWLPISSSHMFCSLSAAFAHSKIQIILMYFVWQVEFDFLNHGKMFLKILDFLPLPGTLATSRTVPLRSSENPLDQASGSPKSHKTNPYLVYNSEHFRYNNSSYKIDNNNYCYHLLGASFTFRHVVSVVTLKTTFRVGTSGFRRGNRLLRGFRLASGCLTM